MANTTQRSVRVDDQLWEVYGDICAALGTDRSSDLNAHIQQVVQDHTEGSTDE